VTIGDDCLIGGGVRIQDTDGHPLDPVLRRQGMAVPSDNVRPVVIGNNVWIAPRAVILKGVTIGENSVVGTGTVVTHDVPSNTVVAGNPARVIRSLERGA
jgi:acetyltransferase-like isoleucine patch superfamily enzyme